MKKYYNIYFWYQKRYLGVFIRDLDWRGTKVYKAADQSNHRALCYKWPRGLAIFHILSTIKTYENYIQYDSVWLLKFT